MLEILHEEAHFMLVNKPSGLFSQSAPGIDNLQEQMIAQLATRDEAAGRPFIGLPHRLDRGTSGVMLLARNQRALKRLCEQFHSRKVGKRYMAIIEGTCLSNGEVWEDYLRKVLDQPRAELVTAQCEGAKLAQMRVLPLACAEDLTLVDVELLTGRMHQIRLQLASRGWPVVGDTSYGSVRSFGPIDPEGRRQHLALHSWQIDFRHPQTARFCSVVASPPETWLELPAVLLSSALAHIDDHRRSQPMA